MMRPNHYPLNPAVWGLAMAFLPGDGDGTFRENFGLGWEDAVSEAGRVYLS